MQPERPDTRDTCPECGAAVPSGATCRDHFHALLALEWTIPGGPGEVAHFYAVATYGIQHPGSMGYSRATLDGLIAAVREKLSCDTSMEEIRRRVRAEVSAAGRVRRREGEPAPSNAVTRWPIVVTDVLRGGADGYQARVEQWARSVIDALDGRDD